MKNTNPIRLIAIGAALVFFFVGLCASICSMFFSGLTILSALLIAGIAAVISFITFYLILKKFVFEQLQLIFKIIRKGKLPEKDELRFSIKQDLISDTAEATEKWAMERQSEIAKLKEQEKFRREFLGNLAHELKTPVFNIQGYILTLLEGGLEDEAVNIKFLERASNATERMASILKDLDDISKMEVDQVELNKTNFDIVELANEVIESLELPSNEKKVKLILDKKLEAIYVSADRSRISQVFTNLLTNAINYVGSGGEAKISFFKMDDFIMTEVSDNGPGISEDQLSRLFERFYRVEQSRDRNRGGSGLGLAIVKHIIETLHEQRISVRSTVGEGSTFSFSLEKSTQK